MRIGFARFHDNQILDGDSAPWCIAPNGEFDYCDIPDCTAADDQAASENSIADSVAVTTSLEEAAMAHTQRCQSEEFQCRTGECVLAAYVCDGHRDCSNGKDEQDCSERELDKCANLLFQQFKSCLNLHIHYRYTRNAGLRLDIAYVERWLDTSASACAIHCKNARGFVCKSFNYHAAKRLCTLRYKITFG